MRVDDLVTCAIDDLFHAGPRVGEPHSLCRDIRLAAYEASREAMPLIVEDLMAYVDRDPSLMGEPLFALVHHSPFMATLCHRIAHWMWVSDASTVKRQMAVSVGHFGRVLTGAEIHPAASIGRRFVLDHGTNTVIGATCVIGEDCYILNGVILGARGISGNAPVKRHPTIGNRVQIGAFARVLGDISVGDDVFVSPHALIVNHVPKGTKMRANPQNCAFMTTAKRELPNAV